MPAPQWPYAQNSLPKINRYANLLPSKPERDFAFAYISYRRGGSTGNRPQRGRITRYQEWDIEDNLERLAISGT